MVAAKLVAGINLEIERIAAGGIDLFAEFNSALIGGGVETFRHRDLDDRLFAAGLAVVGTLVIGLITAGNQCKSHHGC